MGETQPRQQRQPPPSRLGLRGRGAAGGGEIVEVQGGHIVRSTGRKDRHSKVCTAKGPRDRRVRLSAHTAIQFYDVQDRLGYDRPSKAVDWLITKARAAIDELAELPPWNPTSTAAPNQELGQESGNTEIRAFSSGNNNNSNDNSNSSFLPPSMDSDTIKSFFPIGEPTVEPESGSAHYLTQFHSQDLRLSLQSFDNPIFSLHHHQPPPPDNAFLGFDHGTSGWADFQRMVGWNPGAGAGDSSGGGMYNMPVAAPLVFGNHHHQLVSQRGPLQSSNTQSIRAWIDPTPPATYTPMGYVGAEHHQSFPVHHHQHMGAFSGFSGFRIPARIQGEEEEHDGVSDKPSSASSDSLSRH